MFEEQLFVQDVLVQEDNPDMLAGGGNSPTSRLRFRKLCFPTQKSCLSPVKRNYYSIGDKQFPRQLQFHPEPACHFLLRLSAFNVTELKRPSAALPSPQRSRSTHPHARIVSHAHRSDRFQLPSRHTAVGGLSDFWLITLAMPSTRRL